MLVPTSILATQVRGTTQSSSRQHWQIQEGLQS